MKNMLQLLWWQTSKPEDVSTYVNVDLERGNSVFFVLRFEGEKAPKGKHLTSGEKTRKRAMKNKSTNNYETE